MTGGISGGGMASDTVYCAWEYNPDAAAGARFKVLACPTILRLLSLVCSADCWECRHMRRQAHRTLPWLWLDVPCLAVGRVA